MNKVELVKIENVEQIKTLEKLANKIWHEYYNDLVGEKQVNYILSNMQSEEAITKQIMQENYKYLFLEFQGEIVGYTAMQEDKENKKMFISKLYILNSHRGKGFGTQVFNYIEDISKEKGLRAMWLTVYIENHSSIALYEKLGYKKIEQKFFDIGGGYINNDYIMEKQI